MNGLLRTTGALVIAGALAAGGCSGGDQPASNATSAPTSAAGPPLGTFMLGAKVPLPRGDTLQVHSYSADVSPSNPFSWPAPDRSFAVIDVEGCAGYDRSSADRLLNPFFFALVLADNSTVQSGIPVKEPALGVADERQGECHRGLVTFEVPSDRKPLAVEYRSTAASVRWTIP